MDLIDFKQIFNFGYIAPTRKPKLGHYRMVVGLLMLLFIGFNRIWHFTYIRLDAMLCGFFRLHRLPAASTFWRDVDSMGINQGISLIKVTTRLRERVWKQIGLGYYRINIEFNDPMWQPKYYVFNIHNHSKIMEKLDYMHENPVRAGLVDHAEDWRFGSAP